MVLKSFSLGDISSIKNLVSKKIFTSLEETIASRKEQNLTSEVDFICFDSCDIKEVKKLKNSVKIIVEFVSEQVNILKDVEGELGAMPKGIPMESLNETRNLVENYLK